MLRQDQGFVIPSWDQIYSLLLDLAQRIRKDRFVPDVIVGVSRGGWTPGRILSDLLENPEIANVKAEFYLGVAETKEEPVITQGVSAAVEGKKVLIVDDVADTGKSLQLVKAHLLEEGAKDLKIATLYHKPWSVTVPDYYERTTRAWIIFPWERKEGLRKVIERFQQNGKSIEDAKRTLVREGFNPELAERFIGELFEGSD